MSYKLEEISGIGKTTADRLKAARIDTVEKLANAKTEDLLKLKIKGVGKATAEKYIAEARKKLKEVGAEGKLKVKPTPKTKAKPKAKPISEEQVGKLKVLIKQQAECNIGLVGHVDHGIY